MPEHGWMPADYIAPGDVLGDLVGGRFVPGVEVLDSRAEKGMHRITTASGSFVVQNEADFYVFSRERT